MPAVPSFAELGLDCPYEGAWFALVGPPGIDKAVLNRIVALVHDVLADPGLKHEMLGYFQCARISPSVKSRSIGSARQSRIFSPFRPRSRARSETRWGLAQFGGKHSRAKPWKGEGPGVFEVVDDFDGDTYRAVYTVRFRLVVYVLHAFQKKSPRGNRTARTDVELIARRLRVARQDYEARYGKSER